MPAMERLHHAYRGRGLVVLGVNFKESPRDVRAFVDKLGVSFVTVLDVDGAVSEKYRVRGLPVTFLLDREGRVLWDGPHGRARSDEHTSELQSPDHLVCRLLLDTHNT